MQSFLASAFLKALSYSLIASIWQMALLWLLVIVLFKLFKFSSAQKFNLAFLAQLSGFGFFIYTFLYAYSNPASGKIIFDTAAENFLATVSSYVDACMPYLTILYLVVLLLKLAKLIIGYADTQKLKKHGWLKISAHNKIFVEQMTALFSLRRKVKIYLSEKISCPLTIGFLKPIILIPLAAVNHLTTEQLEAVILHELSHVKRADYILYILQSLVEKILFFNFFSKMLGDIIERERENACDDWVLQFKYNSMHYAEALFKLARLKALPALAMPLSGKKENQLLIRIKRLLHNTQSKNTYNASSVVTGLLSIIITAFLFVSFSAKSINQKGLPVMSNVNLTAVNQNSFNKVVAYKTPSFKTTIKRTKKERLKNKLVNTFRNEMQDYTQDVANAAIEKNIAKAQLKINQQYLTTVKASLDSLKQTLPLYSEALNNQLIVTPQVLQKAISYQNFKQIENMLAAAGDSINIKETQLSKNSYKKNITIEAFDKKGNKHVYNVIVELYQ